MQQGTQEKEINCGKEVDGRLGHRMLCITDAIVTSPGMGNKHPVYP